MLFGFIQSQLSIPGALYPTAAPLTSLVNFKRNFTLIFQIYIFKRLQCH